MKTEKTYDDFIASKQRRAECHGFEPLSITAPLFPWQKQIVEWAVRKGRAALFEDCGLGKTAQQLEWAHQVHVHTGGSVLILTPLAVAQQTAREAVKFGIPAIVATSHDDIDRAGIWITNYEKLEHFRCEDFAGVVLDESSILKAFTGKTRQALTAAFANTPYRLCCTATPSPNDYTELGQHADFLGICTPAQMLCTYFINDTFNTGDWRLKKHAEKDFWRWLASWAACISKPSDIGFPDDGYNLPKLNMETITVHVDESNETGEDLFRISTLSATTMHREMRLTSDARSSAVAELVNKSDEPWLIWCNTNDEADALKSKIPQCVEIRGNDHADKKEKAAEWLKGELCICGERHFRTEFAEWTKLNTSRITTSKTESVDSLSAKNITPQTKISATTTTENTTQKTNSNGASGLQKNRLNTTKSEESVTNQIQHTEPKSKGRLSSGLMKTQKQNSKADSKENTDLAAKNMMPCLSHRDSSVQYADHQTTAITTEDSTSITVTAPAEYVDSYVVHAISDSESLETIPSDLNPQQCICGHKSGHRILVSKGSIFGFGLNFQACRNVAFIGLSYSFEDFYQALRRSYRFGQTREVNAYIIQAQTEGAILRAIETKIQQHQTMQENMKKAAHELRFASDEKAEAKTDITTTQGEGWTVHHGDCVRVAKIIPDASIGFAVFSPPFADLFTYSADPQDMGNCGGMAEFMVHFDHLIVEMKRIMQPGREVAVHCVDLLSTKWKHGKIEFQDFSGEIIRAFWRHGFLFHSRICIWKSPVTEMQRTKAHGLLHKTLRADSSDSRVGCADYLLVFRNAGECVTPVVKDGSKYPVSWWQEVASPVWMTVDQGRVLNGECARESADERHICPLQLDVIERAIELWSNPDDLVYSPFTGIGSEGYGALSLGRRFVGSELKKSYADQACVNMHNLKAQSDLFATKSE